MANTTKSASGGAKKSSGTKSTSKKKGTTSEYIQGSLMELVSRREFKATMTFVVGLFLLILSLIKGEDGTFWNWMYDSYFCLFGVLGYCLPLAILFLGVVSVLNRQKTVYIVKTVQVIVLFIFIAGLVHINKFAAGSSAGFWENIKLNFSDAEDHHWSGLTGAFFGGLLYSLGKNQVLANILSILLIAADVMFLFGITLFKLFTKLEKPVKKAGAYTGQAVVNVKNDIDKKAKNYMAAKKQRGDIAALEATRVVNDFYSDDEGERHAAKKSASKNASAPEQTPAPSVFDRFEKKSAAEMEKDKKEAAAPAEGLFNFAPPDWANPKKDEKAEEKAEPLTDAEAKALNGELNEALEAPVHREYVKPPLDCLKMPKVKDRNYDVDELRANGDKLIAALNSFNVSATISDVIPGPTVTRYELSPAPGVKISKFVGLADDLALHMAAPAGLRIEAPIPNKAAIGIEIPNRKKTTVSFREVIDTEGFRSAKSKLNAALGKDIAGDVIFTDIAKMPHLLVAGTTGSGKSVCMNTMIVSLLYNAGPEEVKILLIDPKQVEFGTYNGIPHLLVPVVSDPRKAAGALGWAVTEMLSRYKTLNANGVRDIGAYNSLCEGNDELTKMPQIVIFIDELADLMTVAPAEVEDSIQRIAQMGRAAGMHLVIATQRPSVDVITGVIKANIPSRIALTVKSQIDSRTIIDQAGAEKLMGYGDMLYYPVGIPKPVRVQGAYLTTEEIENIVTFLKANGESQYDDSVQQEIERQAAAEKKKGGAEEKSDAALDKNDDLLMRAIELFVSTPEKASISALQRHLGLGFAKAGRLMDTLEEKGVVGPTEGSKPRKVLITKAQWYEMNAMSSEVTSAGNDDRFEEISAPNA